MRKMSTGKGLVFGLLSLLLFISPQYLLSQTKYTGILNIVKINAYSAKTITINGQEAITEQTILSPSKVEVPDTGSVARFNFSNKGIEFALGTKMDLAFSENEISGYLSTGKATVWVSPNTNIKIQTKDGSVSNSDKNIESSGVIEFIEGKTQVTTLTGSLTFNGIIIPAGASFGLGKGFALKEAKKPFPPFYIYLPSLILISAFTGGGGSTNGGSGNLQTLDIPVSPMS